MFKRVARDSVWSGTPVQIVQYRDDEDRRLSPDEYIIAEVIGAEGEAMITMPALRRASLAMARQHLEFLTKAVADAEAMVK